MVLFCAQTCAVLAAQTLTAVPSRVLADEAAVIRAAGLEPNERIAIQALLEDGAGNAWASAAEFLADVRGVVDTAAQAPLAGSYKEASAMGLVWSMLPASKKVASYQAPRGFGAQTIEFRLMRKGESIAIARLEQMSVAEGVERSSVREGALRGVFFVPAGKEPHPGVPVVGGSEGGVPIRKAAWLASRGFAAFALAYFHYEDLPAQLEAIPLEYFQQAIAWLAQRPEVSAGRLAVMGTSRGGELALQIGSMFPRVGAVVAYVPANVRYPACCAGATRVPYAWTWQSQPLAFLPLRLRRDPALAERAAIAVENTQGPVLMISGEDDRVWRSAEMADAIAARLKHAHFAYSFENLKYPHAGHTAGRPDIVPAWHGMTRNPVSGQQVDWGGSAKGDAESSLDAIPKALAFLRRDLHAQNKAEDPKFQAVRLAAWMRMSCLVCNTPSSRWRQPTLRRMSGESFRRGAAHRLFDYATQAD